MSSLETVARFRCLREEKAGCFEGKSLPTLIEHLAQHFEKDTGYKGHYEFFCEQCNAGFTNRRYASAHKAEHPNHQVTTSVQTGGPSVNRPDSLQRKIYEKWQLYLDYFVGFAPTMPKSLPRLRQNVPMRVGTVDLEEEAGGPRTPRTSTYDESSTSGRNGDAYAYVPKTPRFNYGGRTPSYGGARTPARSPMRTPTYEDGELPYASDARTPMYEPRTPSRKRSAAIDSNSYVLPPAPKAPSYIPCAPVAVPPPPPPPPMYPGGQVAGSYWNPPAQSGGFPAQTGIPPQMDWNNPFASQYAMQFAQMMGMTPNTTGQPISSLATPPMVPPPTQNTNEMSSSYSSNKYQNSETSSMDQSSDNISFSGGRGRGGFGGRGGSYRGGRGGGFGGGRGGGGWNNNGGQGWKQKQGRFNDDNSANNRSFGGSSRGGRDFGSSGGDNKDSFNSSFSVPANRDERRDRSYSRSRSGSPVANLQAERNTSSAELPRTVERGSPRRSFERENRSYSRSRSRSVSPAGSAAASPVREQSAEPGPAANENGDDAPRATSPMPLPDNIFSSPARLDMPLNNQTSPPMNMAAYSPATPDYGGPVMEQHTIKKSDSEDNLMHRESSEAESSAITSTQQVRQQAVAKPITASGCYGGGTGVAPKYGQHRAQFIEIDHVPRMDPAEKTSRSADRKRSQRRGRKSSGSGEDEMDEPAPEKRRKSSRVARASQGKKEKVVADESPSRSQSRSPSP